MPKSLKKGDKVSWNTSLGRTHGRIVRKQTSELHIKDHEVAATKDDPQYVVESDKTGELAAHEPDALTRIR